MKIDAAGRPIIIFGAGYLGYNFAEHLARSKEQGARSKEQGARSKEQGARSKEQGARSKEQGKYGSVGAAAKAPVLCFFDSDPAKNGTTLLGLPVLLPSPVYLERDPVVVLAQERGGQLALMKDVCGQLGYDSIPYREAVGAAPEKAWTFTAARPTAGTFLYVDVVDSCNLRCVNCRRIYRAPENVATNVMQKNVFTRILDKAAQIGFSKIACYNWTECFLHPELPDFALACAEAEMEFLISSNLSLPKIPGLIPTLKNCTMMLVSVSGFSREMHAKNHRGSDIEVVKKHLAAIAAARRSREIATRVIVKFLDFEYNRAEIAPFREYAAGLGLDFMVECGVVVKPCVGDYESDVRARFARMAGSYAELRKNTLMDKCSYRDGSLVVDFRGDAYLCCACLSTPFFRVGSFIEDDYELLQALRQTHPYCAICGTEWSA